jgi:hypothetical protein
MRLLPRSRRGTWLFAAAALLIIAVTCGSRIGTWAYYRAQGIQITTDSQPAWNIDRSEPYIIELARGGGPDGMDRIWIDDACTVNFHRLDHQQNRREMGTLQVPPETLDEILNAVEAGGLMRLHSAYVDAKIADGPEWRFRAQQAGQTKVVHCANYFPTAMTDFAQELDRILLAAGSARVTWAPEYP